MPRCNRLCPEDCKLTDEDKKVIADWVQFCRDRKAKKDRGG